MMSNSGGAQSCSLGMAHEEVLQVCWSRQKQSYNGIDCGRVLPCWIMQEVLKPAGRSCSIYLLRYCQDSKDLKDFPQTVSAEA
jgi:hypothetical protein